MGTNFYKDIKDNEEAWNNKHIIDTWRVRLEFFFDPIGPVKYDVFDQLPRGYFQTLPVVARRLDAIEEHLVKGTATGNAFIRPEERPDVGVTVLQDLSENVRKLSDRIDKLEALQKH